MNRIDIHQHLWPEAFVDVLSRRRRAPRLRGAKLEIQGDTVWDVDLDVHRVDRRLALLDRFELETAVVSLQPTLGPRPPSGRRPGRARRGVGGRACSSSPVNGGSSRLRHRGRATASPGSSSRRSSCSTCRRWRRGSMRCVTHGGFLFVHPATATVPAGKPDWWPAVVDYAAQMQAAYAAWLLDGVEQWPDLDVVFAILAGGAPFQMERLASRGVEERAAVRPRVWLDTASYGSRALDFTMSALGIDRHALRQRCADRRPGADVAHRRVLRAGCGRRRCSRRIRLRLLGR